MNTLGASLSSFRSATETPAGRATRDDEGQTAFGSVLGALSDERPSEARETSTEAEASALPTLPQGDAAPALAMLAALDAAAIPKPPPMDAGATTGADTIGTLIARALPANGGAPALGTGGRPQVAVIAQETHFAPVKPHPVSLTGAVPGGSPADIAVSSLLPGLSEPPVVAPPTDVEADSGTVQAAALAASSSPQVSRAAQAPSLFAAASGSGPVATGAASGSAGPGQPIGAASLGDVSAAKPLAGTDPLTPASPSDPSVLSAASAPVPSASGPRKPAATDAARTVATGTAKPNQSVITGGSAPAFSETETAEVGHTAPHGDAQAGTLHEARLEIGQSGAAGTPAIPAPAAGEPSRQVGAAVLAQVGSVPTAAEASLKAGMDGPLRILTIQLRPDDLGTVLVRMRLRGDQLEMSLHASREETAALLRSDTGALDGLLRSAGYQPDIITIGTGRIDAPVSAESARAGAGAGFDGPGRDAGGAMADQSGRREPDPRDPERRNTQQDAHSDETTPGGPGRIGRYL